MLKQSTARVVTFLMVDESDHLTGKTGLTVTVTLSKNGGSFAAAGGTVAEIANGWYKISFTTTDTNTLGDLSVHCTATGADPTDFRELVVLALPGESSSDILAIKTKTDNLPSDPASESALEAILATIDPVAIAAGVWNRLASALSTTNSIGKLLVDNINATISSRASATNLATLDGKVDIVDGVVDAIKAETDGISDIASDVTAIKAKTDELTFTTPNVIDASITDPVTVGTNNDKTGYALSSAGVDAILDDAPAAELSSIPNTTGTLRQMIQFLFEYFRNRRTATATLETLYKENATTALGTATLSNDGTTSEKGEMN